MDSKEGSDLYYHSSISYYCREKMYHGMQKVTREALKKFSGDPVYKFFLGVSFILQGKLQEGIREIESLKDVQDLVLGSCLAMIYAHRKCQVIDKEAVNELDSRLKSSRKHTTEKALYYAGWFLLQTGRLDKSKEYVDRMIKVAPDFRQGMILKGWSELLSGKDVKSKQTIQYFDIAGSPDVESIFGKAKYFESKNNFNGALEVLNQGVVYFPNFMPILIEKMKVQLALRDWEQTVDTANKILRIESNNIQALRYIALNTICREGNMEKASAEIGNMIRAIDKHEPLNSNMYYESCQLFSRLCMRSKIILNHTLSLAERAVQLDPKNSDYLNEIGYQLMLQSRIREAIKQYHSAMTLNQSSVQALIGIVTCQLHQGQTDSAGQQLEFLKELQQSMNISAEYVYLSSLLADLKGKNSDTIVSQLNQCVDVHFAKLKGAPISIQYFIHLNPDFLLLIVKDLLKYSPSQPISSGQTICQSLKKCQLILETICRPCSGLKEALFYMAKVKFLSGDFESAISALQHCLDREKSYCDAYMLMAEIQLLQGKYQQASQSLEIGLSYDFNVRDHPSYFLIKARIHRRMKQYEESVQTLLSAMASAGIKPGSGSNKPSKKNISEKMKADLYLELAESYRFLNQPHEAAKIMQDSLNEFQGTPEEVRVIIANSELAISRGDIELALSMLRNISPQQTFYIQAREKMAEIYLNHRKDRRLYASCFREIVEKFPTPQSYLLLGDAYMNIQEPERAIEIYEQALKKNPRDSGLARKIGNALIKTHNYGKAINYYEAAVKTGNQLFLRYDLASLLNKLKQYEKAQKVITIALEQENQGNEISTMINRSKYFVLLSEVYQNAGHSDLIVKNLSMARDIQTRVMRRISVEQPDSVPEQTNIAVRICCQMAEHCIHVQDYDTATFYYKEALNYRSDDEKTIIELCKLYMFQNKFEDCRVVCAQLLENDNDNTAANVIMADLMLRKNDFQSAIFHFQNILDKQPDNYEALSKMIEALRRHGRLLDVPDHFTKVTSNNKRASVEAGFNYCKGLYEWYSQNPSGAMQFFNKARRDDKWGEISTYNMIEICINPDNNTLGGETFESVDSDISNNDIKNCADNQEIAIRTAEKLFKDLKTSPNGVNHLVLSNFIVLAKRQKPQAERVLQDFMKIVADERHREQAGAILGIATAHMILKQTPKARNQLKRLAKAQWKLEEAEYLERCWILLVDIYIQSSKYDVAIELLKRVLFYNKSSCKAYEYLGFIMEKEQSYKDAVENYETAWIFGNKSNPVIGYKLAFNYMKAKRYLDAIDVCHDVLAKFPKYPKIQKEVLDKSRSHLRT